MHLHSSTPSAAIAGFDPLQPFLDDPEIEEIRISEADRCFVARRGRPQLTTLILIGDVSADLVERMLRRSSRRPIEHAIRRHNVPGSRLHAGQSLRSQD
jgi:pilus assembly protein CpaF